MTENQPSTSFLTLTPYRSIPPIPNPLTTHDLRVISRCLAAGHAVLLQTKDLAEAAEVPAMTEALMAEMASLEGVQAKVSELSMAVANRCYEEDQRAPSDGA